jgi:hypothetical protein
VENVTMALQLLRWHRLKLEEQIDLDDFDPELSRALDQVIAAIETLEAKP